MSNWYQEIVVEHKELDNKIYHCFNDENFEKLTNERNEQIDKILVLENERDILISKLSEIKANIKYLLEHGEGNGYIRNKYIRGDKNE